MVKLEVFGCCSWPLARCSGPKPLGKNLLCTDFSGGLEPIDVPCTNDVDDEPPPYLEYITKSRLITLLISGNALPWWLYLRVISGGQIYWISFFWCFSSRSINTFRSILSDIRDSHWAAGITRTLFWKDKLKLVMGVLFTILTIPSLLCPFTYHLKDVKMTFARTG